MYEHLLTSGRIRPAALVSDSRPLLERLRPRRPDLAMHWIPNGTEPGPGGTGSHRGEGPVHILAVGRLAPPKGHRVLIEAMTHLRHRPDLQLTIVGDGPLQSAMTAQIDAAGLNGRVRLAGRVPYEHLYRAYEEADLFVMPSLAEGLPIAMVEALGMGLAIVASDIPEHRQVADGNVVTFVPVGDAVALAETIDRLASDTVERRRMGEHGRRLAESHYRWDVITDTYESVLRDAVAGR
jgi:glycosyltransferase involved in cell wall biosynthesis